jgi:chromosome segregation protein
MYLKSLTVFGFKSFADKTSLLFQPGITAIVGPNGCGKSNVADAIRWVLGEQSAKALRGGEMADVIFNGTDLRRPLGLAEVSLTIGNVDAGHLRAAGVEVSYNEVTLTRRVFRDGGSEYFINKVPCRLRDIQQLFMGTGVGRTSYSIMAQGNITQILSSKPEDRRMVFEEAAGITKFKAQKKESLRKLEHTDQNLLRVADLIREVKRQIGSLQRQAGKARRYKQLAHELQHIETQLARHQFDCLQAELHALETALDDHRREIESASARVLAEEQQIGSQRESLAELDREISQQQHQGLELKNAIDRHENRIQFNRERLRELESQNARAHADVAQASERRTAARAELTAISERCATSRLAVQQHQQSLRHRQEQADALSAESGRLQEAVRSAQAELFAAAQQLSRVRNEIAALDLQRQHDAARGEKLEAERTQLDEERTRSQARLEEFTAGIETDRVYAQTQRGSVASQQARLAELQGRLAETSQRLDHALQRQAETRSRLSVLEQLHAAREGYGQGTVAALHAAENLLGSLADHLRVPDAYVPAVEAALGHHLQLVLAEQPETAERIVADLQAGRKGRASIAALALGPDSAGLGAAAAAATVPGTGDWPGTDPLGVVQADPEVRELLRRLLGGIRIVADLGVATAAWRQTAGACDWVTLRGEVLSRHGVYTGGASHGPDTATASVLARKNQIEALQVEWAQIQQQVQDVSRDKGALQNETAALAAGIQRAESELRNAEVTLATREGELQALRNSARLLEQKLETVHYEVQALAAQAAECRERRTALSSQAQAFETQEKAAQLHLKDTQAAIEVLAERRERATAAVTEARIALATQEQLCLSFQQQQQPLEQRLVELDQLIQQRRAELATAATRNAHAEREIADSQRRIQTLQHDRERLNRRLAELALQRQTGAAELEAAETGLRARRELLAQRQQERTSLEVERAQKHMAADNLRERIQQKYQVALESVRSECITITFADEGHPKVHTLSPEEMAASGAATDWDAVGRQVAALQQRLDEMGPVNLVAIEEYEETEQRHQFLSAQHDDLVRAKQQLLDVINRINAQTRSMFAETFQKVRENFQAMFTEIFGGGKADLHLLDEGDMLESGIDIVARPPGKQLQSISLLSGGEQTMTAVALLFAIYQVKPSPFCVLDELDAPLDESNINRFIRILQRFLSQSQFVIITHNKRTIGMANVLYGVTMEEQGVSRIVSVKFHRQDESVTDHVPTPLVPKAAVASVEDEEDRPHTPAETIEIVMVK